MSFSLILGPLQASKEKDHGIFPIGVIIGLIVIFSAHYFSSPYRKLPPGPRGYPIIGNLLELRSEQWLKFAEWRKKYGQFVLSILSFFFFYKRTLPGDIVYLNVAGQPLVIFNSNKVAGDLLDRRSTIYSDRPNSIVVGDIMTRGLLFAVSHYNDA
jgi:hypothetical protein